MALLRAAHAKRVPFFVNPYYLSLVNVRPPSFAAGADLAIRSYVIYSAELIEAYGDIEAWEKEDQVRPGKPNVAGWLLPSEYNIHRRYPEVAILIPDSMGRACGGLCAACQRMYDYQRGRFAFNFDRLQPNKRWPKRLNQLMSYFATDSQLRDILITGGDALMSTEKTLGGILDAVYEMAIAKRIANEKRAEGDKFAEMVRVRLGTRLPVYLPQRITPKLVALLRAFREKARAIGIRQFVVQTHFESPMEVTPEAREAVARLTSAGWTVTNQQVFTAAASRRGHTAKLRRTLNEIGVLPYYTFSCKGYYENRALFATNARAVQEVLEEKSFGVLSEGQAESVRAIAEQPEHATKGVPELRESAALPFLATDRTVLNLPGVGKSLSFRVIGMTADGRRILAFEHDPTRAHSPVIHEPGRVLIVESKSIRAYLDQLAEMGEDVNEYASIWGHSIGETESRSMVYEYPEQRVQITDKLTHFALDSRSGRSEVSARAKVN
jgi:lysine 2,3-aminomutase